MPHDGRFTQDRSGRGATGPRLLAERWREGGNRFRFAGAKWHRWLHLFTSGPLLSKLHGPTVSKPFGRVTAELAGEADMTLVDLPPRSSLSPPLRKSPLRRQQLHPHDHGWPCPASVLRCQEAPRPIPHPQARRNRRARFDHWHWVLQAATPGTSTQCCSVGSPEWLEVNCAREASSGAQLTQASRWRLRAT